MDGDGHESGDGRLFGSHAVREDTRKLGQVRRSIQVQDRHMKVVMERMVVEDSSNSVYQISPSSAGRMMRVMEYQVSAGSMEVGMGAEAA